MLISKNRIIPTAILVGACFAFTGAALTSTASADPGPVVVRCNGLVVTDKVPANWGPVAFVPANPNGNNVILGTMNRDVIFAGAGNDTICSLGGLDENWGEGGNDTIFSGTDDDRNLGGFGADRFDCGPGGSDVANGGGDLDVDVALPNCENQFSIP